MTSNLGSHLIQERLQDITSSNRDQVIGELRVQLMDMLKATIRPEFLNRVDEIIVFKPLTEKEIREIVDLQLIHLQERVERNNMKIEFDEEVKDWLGKLGYDIAYGARPLKRTIQKHLVNVLSEKILDATFLPGDTIQVGLNKQGLIEFVKKPQLRILIRK
jgi:ATP-dependent Clp protease ATP-binding subunit ClpB